MFCFSLSLSLFLLLLSEVMRWFKSQRSCCKDEKTSTLNGPYSSEAVYFPHWGPLIILVKVSCTEKKFFKTFSTFSLTLVEFNVIEFCEFSRNFMGKKKVYCHSVATYEAQLTEVTFKSRSKWRSNILLEQSVAWKLCACTFRVDKTGLFATVL